MYYVVKRGFDVILSLIIVIILIPFFVILFPLLKFTGEGHVFYYQERIGYKNRRFNIIKFATMLKNSPNLGTGMITLRNDPRVTPMGRFLRITKLNELPQIFNILLGDMSVVGPRPLVQRTFDAYPVEIQQKIYNAKPGITGIGSIVFRDEEQLISNYKGDPHEFYKGEIAPYKGRLEAWYLDNRSLLVDIQICFLTAWVILFPSSRLMFKLFKTLPKRTNTDV